MIFNASKRCAISVYMDFALVTNKDIKNSNSTVYTRKVLHYDKQGSSMFIQPQTLGLVRYEEGPTSIKNKM